MTNMEGAKYTSKHAEKYRRLREMFYVLNIFAKQLDKMDSQNHFEFLWLSNKLLERKQIKLLPKTYKCLWGRVEAQVNHRKFPTEVELHIAIENNNHNTCP